MNEKKRQNPYYLHRTCVYQVQAGLLDRLEPPLTFVSELSNLFFQSLDNIPRTVNRRAKPASFSLPTADSLHLCQLSSVFRFNLVAQFAFLADWNGLHDEFHATCFTCSIFSIAMLSEMSPFPITTLESVLIEKAHV